MYTPARTVVQFIKDVFLRGSGSAINREVEIYNHILQEASEFI